MQQKDRPVNLRGHHLICIHTFAGEGYSSAFANNMQRIIDALKMPTQTVRIVEGLDHICTFCPHSNWTSCLKDDDKVKDMDKRALSVLKIELGDVYKSLHLYLKTAEAIHKGLFCEACSECDWFASHCKPLLCCD